MPAHIVHAAPAAVLARRTNWEKAAETRWGDYITNVHAQALAAACEMAGKAGSFLEVGCDGGRWSVLLSQRGWRATCTDINEQSLRLCQERLPEARCVLVNSQDCSLPCDRGSLNLLLCIEVISVLRTEWFLNEAVRMLDDRGLLVGVFLNKHSPRGYFHHLVDRVRGTFDWYQRSYTDWKRSARKRGLEFVYEQGYCWFPFSRKSNSPLVPLAVHSERWLGLHHLTSVSPWIVFIARKRSG